ncbi:MAG TPA: TIM barrel protein [Pirellulaceae bacterium]|nr:TIM barrel protein [Pirellulaceae bacterium]
MSHDSLTRRHLLAGTAGALAASTVLPHAHPTMAAEPTANWKITKGRIKQSVVSWCFNPMPVEELAAGAAALGFSSLELADPKHWPTLAKHGLTCAIAGSHGFAKGWNHKENWEFCKDKIEAAVEASADFGCPNVITFSGMLEGIDPDEGKKNTVEGLKTVIGLAEEKKINLCLEMLNTRVDENMKGHPGYQCDSIEWAADVCKAIGSPRMKILFDIYHVQIMQGDVIVRIRQFKDLIAHYHTAGVPGRRELDDAQENNYSAIMKAIVETGYTGYVGQEFIPTQPDKIASLRQAAMVCDV